MNEVINESIARITCPCGQEVQVVNEAGDDWDEAATAAAFMEHYATCYENPEFVAVEEE
jgi:hypothetical protein